MSFLTENPHLCYTIDMEKIYDVAIVGGGAAGYEAALTLTTLRRDFIWFGNKKFGDKLPLAENVSNFLSFTGTGSELFDLLERQSKREGIEITPARIDNIYATGSSFLLTQNQESFHARTVILATGVESAGSLKGELDFVGRGVSYCAVCDGALYRGKKIAAVLTAKDFEHEADYLAGFADTVYAFCLYPQPHLSANNIQIVSDIPLRVEGEKRVNRIVTKNASFEVDGVFMLKNATPPSALVGGLETENGHVKVNRDMSTNIKGLFAAGDVTGRPYQYIKAAGEGLVAAFSANEYLTHITK